MATEAATGVESSEPSLALTADVDADRTVIQARLTELGRRIDETYARAR